MTNKLKLYWQLMRFNKPIGILLLLWPTLWALWIASLGHPSPRLLFIFISGAVVMRAAGCVINDIADRHIDSHVARTKMRPLAAGHISLLEACVIFAVLCLLALGLFFLLQTLTKLIALVALALTILYPFSKRWLPIPQLLLGLAFACSVLMVFMEVQHALSKISWLIYAIAVLWPIAYDTEYAMVDREDDLKINVRSSAILFGRWDRFAIGLLQFTILLLLGYLGYICSLGFVFGLALAVVALLFAYQQKLIQEREPNRCFSAFLNNNWVGLIIFVSINVSFLGFSL